MSTYFFVFVTNLAFSSAALTSPNIGEVFLAPRGLSSAELDDSLESVLQALPTLNDTRTATQQEYIESRLQWTFDSLPKDEGGRLAAQAMRYLVHGYFSQEHGWLVTGLTPHLPRRNASAAPDLHEAAVLHSTTAPPELLSTLLEAQRLSLGFSLRDCVVVATAMERLIVDESLKLLDDAYTFNGFRTNQSLDEREVRELLMSFLMMYEVGADSDLDNSSYGDYKKHADSMLQESPETDHYWASLHKFQNETVRHFLSEHPADFVDQRPFSYTMASELVTTLSHTYGRWQNHECNAMKAELVTLDKEGYGRIPLRVFYSQPDKAMYKFEESVDYLRQIGALDETHPRETQVIISNYLAGPSNCVGKSKYYSVCCISECEGLLGQIEQRVMAPTASFEALLDFASQLSSSTVDAPRTLSKPLEQKLRNIADQHDDGQIPLHGRLFAQWLHYAFPLECQHPGVESEPGELLATDMPLEALTQSYWEDMGGHAASLEEKERYTALDAPTELFDSEQENPLNLHWSDEEVLPFVQPHRSLLAELCCLRFAVKLLSLMALFGGVLMTGAAAARTVAHFFGKSQFVGNHKAAATNIHSF